MTLRADLEAARASLDRALLQLPPGEPGTGEPPPGRRVIRPGSSSQALQDALNTCDPGDIIALDRTWRYEQEYVFDRELDPPAMLVTDDTRDAIAERRIGPADAQNLSTLSSGNAMPVLRVTGKGLSLIALQILSQAGQNEIIVHGTDDSPFDGPVQDPKHITYDRILIQSPGDCKRGIRGHGQYITVSRSHIANIVRAGQDCQAFFASRGHHFSLTDSYLGASGENVLFGGEDNPDGTNPSDILVEDCHMHKPQAWRAVPRSVKNLFEAKNATRLVVRNCLFDGCWTDAQNGFAILFSTMNQNGRAPWTIIQDVLFERNWIKGAENGFNMTGRDGIQNVSQQAKNIVIRKCVVEVAGVFMQPQAEMADLTVEDCVIDNGYNIATLDPGGVKTDGGGWRPAQYCVDRFRFNRNLARHNDYGIKAEAGSGTVGMAATMRATEFLHNGFVGLPQGYPETTRNITSAELDTAKQALLAELGWS